MVTANYTATTSELIDAIWGNTPPQHPESALHIVVSRLRRTLGCAAPRLVRERLGYRLDVGRDELDLSRARVSFSDAQEALADADHALAATLLEATLACWSGDPLSDVANFPFYDAAVRQLRDLRACVLELRNVAYLRCGRDREVLDDIDAWTGSHPWRERLRSQQMIALYRTGRQIEALAVYDDFRHLLVTHYGVDPCEEIQELHRRILRQDPSLLESPVETRDRVLAEPLREITFDPADVVIVEGGPGVEKDWLVVEIPRRVQRQADDEPYLGVEFPRVALADSLGMVSALLCNGERARDDRDAAANSAR